MSGAQLQQSRHHASLAIAHVTGDYPSGQPVVLRHMTRVGAESLRIQLARAAARAAATALNDSSDVRGCPA